VLCFASSPTSQSVSEALEALNDLTTIVRTLVRHPELQVQQQRNDNNQPSSYHAGSNARNVVRSVLSAKDGSADDTTHAASANKCG
jgi:hypothetical protein